MYAALPTRDGHEQPRPGVLPGAKLSVSRMQRCRRATRQYAEELSAH